MAVKLDKFGTQSGLKDEFSFSVRDSRADYNEDYMEGERALVFWTGPDFDDGEDVTLQIPCGAGWQQGDQRGSTLVHDDGAEKVQGSSFYGMLIDWIAGPKSKRREGFEAVLDHFEALGLDVPDPLDMSIWAGTRWRCERQAFKFGKEIGVVERVMPIEYLGSDVVDEASGGSGGKKKGKKAAKSKPEDESRNGKAAGKSKAAKPSKPAKGKGKDEGEDDEADSDPLAGLDKKLVAKLKLIARKSDDHDEFMEAALDIDAVAEDEALLDRVTDPDDLYAVLVG